MATTHTQVGIIGAGPAGLMLAHLLHRAGIDCVILENRSREYVEGRLRAGLLEQNTVELLGEIGMDHRLQQEGIKHEGVYLSFDGKRHRIPFADLTGGRCITIYGQRQVVKDLIQGRLDQGGKICFEAEATRIEGIEGDRPVIHYTHQGEAHELRCEYVAGCDGYHGVGRQAMPADSYQIFEIEYPFSWLGILADVAPSSEELIYAYHADGFALHSYRSPSRSRLYIQVDNAEKIEDWSDDRVWSELKKRLEIPGWELKDGPVVQKGITAMRSFMIDNMQHGRLFLAGDAAHIVPPTGGKGLNLAVADVKILAQALDQFYQQGDRRGLDRYTDDCLRRIWRVQDFSNTMTYQFHKQAPHGSFDYHLQKARFDYITQSPSMATTIAENYVGLKEV